MALSRRLLLGAGVGMAVAPLAACGRGGSPVLPPPCRQPESLTTMSTLGGAPLSYEETGREHSFDADPRFVELLEDWAADWVATAGLGPLVAVSSYGAHVDKCPSWHAAGRAFDFAELVHESGSVSCRYDLWGDDGAAQRDYWRLAASLSTRFTYTLCHPYNSEHHNHIHVDNGVNGYSATSFREGSSAQTQVVQGVLRHVFGADVAVTGEFDDTTREAVRDVQRAKAITDRLASEAGWRAFLGAAVAH